MKHLLALALALAPPAGSSPADGERLLPDPELRALFDYDAGADPELQIVSSVEGDGYRQLDVTYASPVEGRVPAFLYEPLDEGPHPAILLMHGLPGSRDDTRQWGPSLARAGAVVLAISAPWARPGKDGPVLFTEEDRRNQIQLMQDLRRGLDLLQLLPYVDGERLAYVGGSYGGAMGGLLAGIEPRIDAFVLVIGDGGLVAHFTGSEDEDRHAGVDAEAWERWLRWMEPIEPSRWVRFATAELLFQNGRHDPAVPPADAERYHTAAAGTRHTVRWYDCGHDITSEMRRDQLRWLAERIGIDGDADV